MKDKVINLIRINKRIIIFYLVTIIILNLFFNFNYFASLFNNTEPIIYDKSSLVNINNYYEIKDINTDINMIKINFGDIPKKIEINYTSDEFNNYNHHNSGYKNDTILKKDLIVFYALEGNVHDIKINLDGGSINSIIFNPKIEYSFNFLENFILFFVFFIFKYIFKRNDKLNLKENNQKYIVIGVLLFFITLSSAFCIFSLKDYKRNIYDTYYVNAVMDGKLELDHPVNDYLNNAKNPYDTSNRNYEFLWDASYYNGKYYCYFGIWPIISLLVPFKLLTNQYLVTPIASLFYAVLSIIATYLLYSAIIKKYFKKINFQTYLLSFVFILLGSKLMWCIYRPSFYELVSLAAYFHVILGLYLVLFSKRKIINFIGYWSLALAVLCRPTSLFCSILILPKLWKRLREKDLTKVDFIYLTIPYFVVGASIMYMNYIRFDSIFEFGVSYQLTTNNLNANKSFILNAIFGIYNYLFSGIKITLFPIRLIGVTSTIPLLTDFHVENIGGGVITTSVLGIVILFIPKIFKYMKEKELKLYIILSLSVALGIIFISSSVGALIGRYMLDFNYIFYFVIVILSLYILKLSHYKSRLINIYYILTSLSIAINFLILLTNK